MNSINQNLLVTTVAGAAKIKEGEKVISKGKERDILGRHIVRIAVNRMVKGKDFCDIYNFSMSENKPIISSYWVNMRFGNKEFWVNRESIRKRLVHHGKVEKNAVKEALKSGDFQKLLNLIPKEGRSSSMLGPSSVQSFQPASVEQPLTSASTRQAADQSSGKEKYVKNILDAACRLSQSNTSGAQLDKNQLRELRNALATRLDAVSVGDLRIIAKDYTREEINQLIAILADKREEASEIADNFVIALNELINHRKSRTVSYPTTRRERRALARKLRTGDVIFFKLRPEMFSIKSAIDPNNHTDYGILKGQQASKLWTGYEKNEESHSYVHVGLIVKKEGEVFIAEATTDLGTDVRLVPFDDEAFQLNEHSNQEFRIIRPLDTHRKATGALAGIIADETRTTQEERRETTHKYTMMGAIASLFRNSKMCRDSRKRLLLTFAQLTEHLDTNPRQPFRPKVNGNNREFFCSYFVGFCLQNAALLGQINAMLDDGDKQSLEEAKGNPIKQGQWVKSIEKKHREEIKRMIKESSLNFNPKKMTPQQLRGYMFEHPDRFENILIITGKGNEDRTLALKTSSST